MRILFNIFSIATFFLLAGCQQKAVVPLSFYIVSEEKIDGGQFIDTPDFPKLGYIGVEPDLIITKLESVVTSTNQVMINGKSNVEPSISILMQTDDAKKFSTLTEKAVGKQVLLKLGDVPLIAPRINMPIETPSLQISLGTQANQNDQNKIEDELQQLVH
jgi:hypothetical protein